MMKSDIKAKIGEFGLNGLIVMLACGFTALKIWALDNDAWFILNCGRYVLENGIPHEEFATIHTGLHYVMQQWLTAVIFWKVYSYFGADGLLFLTWLTGFILIFVYFKFCLYISKSNIRISILLAVTVTFFSMIFINTRPQIFSTLILLIEVFLLEKYFVERKIRTLCLLPLLSVLLVNLHAALYPMIIVVLLPYLAESLILRIKKRPAPIKPLILTMIGIFLAGFLNPYGFEAMNYVFTSMSPDVYTLSNEIKSPIYLKPPASLFYLVVLIVYSILIIVANFKKIFPPRYFFLSFGMIILAFYSFRCLFWFLILGTLPLAYALKDWHPFEKSFNLPPKCFIPVFILCGIEIIFVYIETQNSTIEVSEPIKIISSLTVIFLICFIFFFKREGHLFGNEIFILRCKPVTAAFLLQIMIFISWAYFIIPPKKYEIYKPALDFLLSENRAEDITLWGDVFTGSYAEFRGVKCYIDVRNEVFIPSNNHKKNIDREYIELLEGKLNYKEFFARYNFTHIFITSDYEFLYSALSQDKHYRPIFEYDLKIKKKVVHGKIFVPVKNN